MSGKNTMSSRALNSGKKGSTKKMNRKVVGYERYIYKVMKEVNPNMEISSKGMSVLNHFMEDMFEKIVETSSMLSKYVGRSTLTSMKIHNAVKMVLPGELAKHAMSEGAKAVVRFATYEEDKSKEE